MARFEQLPAKLDVVGSLGDDLTVRVDVVDDGVPVDVSGWTFEGVGVTVTHDDGGFRLTWPTGAMSRRAWSVQRTTPPVRTLLAGGLWVSAGAASSVTSDTAWTLVLQDGGPVELQLEFGSVDLSGLQARDEKGQPGGYAGLDAEGKVPAEQATPGLATEQYVDDAASAVTADTSVSAGEMAAALGSPTLGVFNRIVGWTLPQGVNTAISGTVRLPPAWTQYQLDVWFTNLGAASGDVRLQAGERFVTDDTALTLPPSYGAATTAAPAQHVAKKHSFPVRVAPDSEFLVFNVYRLAGVVEDTLAADLAAVAVTVRRVL